MDFLKFRHVIWDWNGTLLDDAELCVGILNSILAEEALPLVALESYREEFNFPVRDYYRKVGLDCERRPFEEFSDHYIRRYNESWLKCRVHDGATELLEAFRDCGVGQSILSASEKNVLKQAVSHYGLEPYFRELVGLDDFHARGKLEQGRRLVNTLDCKPDEILLLGDTLHDLDVAKSLGLHCILFAHGHHSQERLENSGARVFCDFTEFGETCLPENIGNLTTPGTDLNRNE